MSSRRTDSFLRFNYYDGMDELTSETDGLDSTWSKTMASQATYQLTSISAQTNGTQVSCQIVKNGEVVDQQQAVGRFTVVTCSAA